MMNSMRKDLVDRMIRLYGSKSHIVIEFAGFCERFPGNVHNDKMLTILVEAHEAFPVNGSE